MIHNLLELIAFGTLGFWLLLIIDSLFIMGCIENESRGWSVIWATIAVTLFASTPLIHVHWTWLLIGFLIYFVIGGAWSLLKWSGYVRDRIDAHRESTRKVTDQITLKYKMDLLREELRPSQNKGNLYLWITFWPWSVLWTSVRDVVKNIYRILLKWYEGIAARQLDRLDTIK